MFKLCQKPFAERKFEDQDQDWIENKSPQHSIQVGLSIQVVRPIIQHPRPGRCLLQIQVPLILTQLGLIDSQPIPTWSFRTSLYKPGESNQAGLTCWEPPSFYSET
ncbi:unnamed protein product [Arabidopsis thaliana]|jgi:hypothetical protein|uniref:Uncharacterized protein n=4 Tax=Arabidopsis TaxID=3701 RepID=A0A654GF03_ARATH|nr:uncharacterized protein AT2G07787 [Arabidopsis thaliana]KAG7529265.1 hypothetical protein ISN45_Un97g000490 [Arabidopsis thaliana x Arabidopsis arenosa]KAG7529329.1 hypothetical protein ISN44_Un143g000150 [Arabidopsis suecica]AEC06117.1 hypothetical protein AT2G07787 [Arabidopsis thaliana]CAA0413869.1 unnamed protein product [Arabidopsis thaliana]VYS71746.1 unnamed protein product [Arabidopsis thaliana]|eukprot:NP_973441.1 hypothetical protein AT2G07787 [Arabidopsis thaliana]